MMLVLLAAAFTLRTAPASAQERVIELPVATITAHDVIDAVQGQTDYLFTTNQNTRLDSLTVEVKMRAMTVKAVLNELLAGSGLVYRLIGSYIVITTPPVVQKMETPGTHEALLVERMEASQPAVDSLTEPERQTIQE